MNALARQLEEKGTPLESTGQGMKVSIGQDSAAFTLKERTRTQKHEPTAEELAAEKRREEKLQKYYSSRQWHQEPPGLFQRSFPEHDLIYTGELVFQADGYADGVRRKWADGKTQRIETLVPDIVIGLGALLALRKAQREEREEQHRKWVEEERRRELARRREEREKRRKTYFDSVMALERELRDLRSWLSSIEGKVTAAGDTNFRRMETWARERVEDIEATLDPTNLEKDLGEKKLFPPVDDLRDPERIPPREYWSDDSDRDDESDV